MMAHKSRRIADPVVPDQGGRQTRGDPGNAAMEEEIRRRAYELFERRGKKHGYDLQDWLHAEGQVSAEIAQRQVLLRTASR